MYYFIYLLLVIVAHSAEGADDSSTNDLVNLSSDQIAAKRGFSVKNHYVTSEDGYIINVVHILPVNKSVSKRPVIFNHGSTQSSTYFMTNSVNARPKDLSNLDASSMSKSELEQLLAHDPLSKCLPLLLACCGHPVILINRRGTEYSLGKQSKVEQIGSSMLSQLTGGFFGSMRPKETKAEEAGGDTKNSLQNLLQLLLKPQLNLGSIPNTIDSNYWNFSLDEQAIYDLPAIIKFVLKETGSEKVAYVGHSLGNGLMFMLQSEQPEWADKVEPFLAWSPDFYLGHTTSILRPLLVALQPVTTLGSFPFPPTPINPLTRTLLATLCQTKLAQVTICRALEQAMWGNSGDQQETLPAFMASQFYSISSHEAAQLAQNSERGKMYHFDFGKLINLKVYGQADPPIYNVSRIRSRSISLWHGAKDALATITDVELLKSDLEVQVDDRFINEIPFNHYDLMFGRNVSQIVNLPSLQLIQSYK